MNSNRREEARRWSGEVRMYISFNDQTNCWDIAVNTRDGRRKISVGTRNWVAQGNAVDTPEAWDAAAHAALSFAGDEDDHDYDGSINVYDHAAYTEDGDFHIGRSFKKAFPR